MLVNNKVNRVSIGVESFNKEKFRAFILVIDDLTVDTLLLLYYNLIVVNQLVIRVLLPDKRKFKGIMKSLKNLLMNGKKYTHYFVIVFCCIFMKGGFLYTITVPLKERKKKMKTNELDYYSKLANWSFEDIDCTSEVFTDWIYEEEIKKRVNENSRILDLGTAAGEKLLKEFPDCDEIIGTDFLAK